MAASMASRRATGPNGCWTSLGGGAPARPEQAEGPLVVPRRVLVGQEARGAIARPHQVVDRRPRVADRRGQREVVRDLRQVGVEVVSVVLLEHGADRGVELEALGERQVLVQRLADQLVDERIPSRHRRVLRDHAGALGLGEDVEETSDAQLARSLQHAEGETINLRDVKGLRYIACLLGPGKEIHVLELVSAVEGWTSGPV
jgi:hypothetical protein